MHPVVARMTNAELIANVAHWNANPRLHKLFCRICYEHPALVAVERHGAVELECIACDYHEAVPQLLHNAWIHTCVPE